MKMNVACGMLVLTLLAGCATETEYKGSKGEPSFNDLPIAAQRTIKNRAPNASIADINKQTRNGNSVYEVTLAEFGRTRELRVAEDGTVVTTQSRIDEKAGAPRVETK